jgi:hypothetical protein
MRALLGRLSKEARLDLVALAEGWPALLFLAFWVVLAFLLEGK